MQVPVSASGRLRCRPQALLPRRAGDAATRCGDHTDTVEHDAQPHHRQGNPIHRSDASRRVRNSPLSAGFPVV